MNTQQNQSQHKNEQGKQNLKQPEAGHKQTQAKPNEKASSPTQKHK